MEFIKKNRFAALAIAIFLIFVLILIQIKNIFFPDEAHAIYGDRLEGRGNVVISTDKQKKIESNLKSTGFVKKASVRISGRIIEVSVVVEAETSVDVAKELSAKVTDKISNKEIKYYDIQIFISKEEKTNDFPIIGYKHHKKKDFSWTKNR